MDFSNKVVLITGASSGIGAACAVKFAQLNANLVLVGRNEENLKQVGKACEENGLKHFLIIADISKDEDCERIVKETIDCHGQIDILINNAGITSFGGMQLGMAAFDGIMATNIRGPYLLTSLVIQHLVKTKGTIVNISSILATKPKPLMMPYCLSKAAMDMFTKCLALEMGPKGIRVNSVNPGPVKTEIFKKAGVTEEDNSKMFESLQKNLPLRKVSESEEIADLVIFLASDKAGSITGVNYTIDCGLSLCESVKVM